MKYTLPLLALAIACQVHAQSCCQLSAPEAFNEFAKDGKFVNSHFDPIPFVLQDPKGSMVHFKTPDGKEAQAYEIKSAKPSDKYVIVIHEWWGLNDYVKQESDKLWSELGDVNILALDLYDTKVATVRDSAAKYMQAVKAERAEAIIQGALEHAGKKAKIATIGWCFGGGWSLQASIIAGARSKACIMYYGMPETNKEKLKKLEAPVLGLFANKDAWISPKVVDDFDKEMKGLGKVITVKEYDADHAFANPSNPKFNKEASEDAHKLELEFLKLHLK
ncbi:MAG: dienelactone hydrolase family protein [Bacteroidetes bacterium]|nr:dienelactone hydrolase family protein [Bacteroidota bacterium]